MYLKNVNINTLETLKCLLDRENPFTLPAKMYYVFLASH